MLLHIPYLSLCENFEIKKSALHEEPCKIDTACVHTGILLLLLDVNVFSEILRFWMLIMLISFNNINFFTYLPINYHLLFCVHETHYWHYPYKSLFKKVSPVGFKTFTFHRSQINFFDLSYKHYNIQMVLG